MDRQADRHRDRKRKSQTERRKDRQRDRKRETETKGLKERERDRARQRSGRERLRTHEMSFQLKWG